MEMSGVYEAQKALIDQVHDKQGVDIYVAKFNGITNEGTKEYTSYSMWSKDCVSLIPKTERVMFFNNDLAGERKTLGPIDWDIVAQKCGAMLKETNHTPTRYLVDAFPSEKELESMKAAQATRD